MLKGGMGCVGFKKTMTIMNASASWRRSGHAFAFSFDKGFLLPFFGSSAQSLQHAL